MAYFQALIKIVKCELNSKKYIGRQLDAEFEAVFELSRDSPTDRHKDKENSYILSLCSRLNIIESTLSEILVAL